MIYHKKSTTLKSRKEHKMKNEIIIREPELYFDSIHQELNNFLRDTFLIHSMGNFLYIKRVSH